MLSVIFELVRAPLTLLEAARGLSRLDSLKSLDSLDQSLRRLSEADGPLDRLADVSETLRRLANLDESLRELSALDATLDRIASVGESLERIAALTYSLERLAATTEGLAGLPDTIEELHVTVQRLGAAIQPIARLAGRIPGSGTRADRRRAVEEESATAPVAEAAATVGVSEIADE